MYSRYLPPLFPFGQIAFMILSLGIIGIAILVFPNRKRVLLAISIFIAAWQGGIWFEFIRMDIRLFHFVFLALLMWNLNIKKVSIKYWKPYLRILIPWCLLILWSIFSVSVAIDPNSARQGPARFIIDMLFFITIIYSIKTPKDFRFLIICLAFAIIGQSILALIQFKFMGITFGVIDDIRTNMWWRSRGTYRHPNHLGMFNLILIPIVIRGAISGLANKDRILFYICSISTLFGSVALITTYNRGSWIGLAIGICVMIFLDLLTKKSKTKIYAMGFLVLALGVGAVGSVKFGDVVVNRVFFDDQDRIFEGRQSLEAEGMAVVKQHYALGVGYANQRYYGTQTFVHNLYILIAAEIGVPGLLLFLWFLFEYMRLIRKAYRSKIDFVKNYSHGFVASFVGFIIGSIPGPDFWINNGVQLYFWMAMAVVVSLNYFNGIAYQMKKVEQFKKLKLSILQPKLEQFN